MKKIKLFFTWFVASFSRFMSDLDKEERNHTDDKCPSCGKVISKNDGFVMLIDEEKGFILCHHCLSEPQNLNTQKIVSNLRTNFFTTEELVLSGIAIERFKNDVLWDNSSIFFKKPALV